MAFASSLKKGQIQVGCQLCDEGSKIHWKCFDCDVFMCTKCKDNIHSKFPNFNNHKVLDIKEVGEQDSRFRDVKCQQHTGQPCCLFCKTCKELVCYKCIPKIHNGHDFVGEEEYGIKQEKIRNKKTKIEMNLKDLKKMKEEITNLKKFEYSKYENRKKDILAQRVAIEKLVEELLNELDDKWEKVNQDFESKQNEVDMIEQKLLTQNISIDKLVNSTDFIQFFYEVEGLLEDNAQINTKYSSMPKFVPGNVTKANIGTFLVDTPVNSETKKEFKVKREFTSDLKNIDHTAVCSDGSLWIFDIRSDLLQHIQINRKNIQELFRLNTRVFGMAVTPGDELLICGESTMKQVSRTGEMKDAPYSVAPLLPRAVHVTSSNRVIIGARTPGLPFPATGRRVVIIMDQEGDRLVEFEMDRNKEPLFTIPRYITSTSEGNICVIDKLDSDHTGRVVVSSPTGDVINTYSGHSDINNKIPFRPTGIVTTALNNIILVDFNTGTIHILDSEGHFITYYSTKDLGIIRPYSVAVFTTGKLFIGCRAPSHSKGTYRSLLYKVEFSGF